MFFWGGTERIYNRRLVANTFFADENHKEKHITIDCPDTERQNERRIFVFNLKQEQKVSYFSLQWSEWKTTNDCQLSFTAVFFLAIHILLSPQKKKTLRRLIVSHPLPSFKCNIQFLLLAIGEYLSKTSSDWTMNAYRSLQRKAVNNLNKYCV